MITWLWPGRIPFGKLTIIEGDPGMGKSTLTLDVAAAVSTGRQLPGGDPTSPMSVLLLSAEDGAADTIRPRLEAAGAEMGRVHVLEGVLRIPRDVLSLKGQIRHLDVRLLVIDPLVAFLESNVDAHKDQDVRRALAPLAALGSETGCAIVCVRHLAKGKGKRAIDRGGGSVGIGAAARSLLQALPDPDDPGVGRVLVAVKCNLSAPPMALRYRLAPTGTVARVVYTGECDLTADDLAAVEENEREGAGKAIDKAVSFLRRALAAGPLPAAEVLGQACKEGIKERTLDSAKSLLKVASERRAKGWIWSLPAA